MKRLCISVFLAEISYYVSKVAWRGYLAREMQMLHAQDERKITLTIRSRVPESKHEYEKKGTLLFLPNRCIRK